MVAPQAPAPTPQSVPHPQARVVWVSPCGRYRATALDWEDGHPPTYQLHALHKRQWHPASGEDLVACLMLLLAQKDEHPHSRGDGDGTVH